MFRQLWWMLCDALQTERELFIDLKRVNQEDQSYRLRRDAVFAEDQTYRRRVMERMMKGYACAHPPLYKRSPECRSEHGQILKMSFGSSRNTSPAS